MKQSISLPLETFVLVKGDRIRESWNQREQAPRWVQQIRAIRLTDDEKRIAQLSAQLVVEHNAQFDLPSILDAGYDSDTGNVYKLQKDKSFLLAHKRWVDDRGNLHNDNDAALVSGQQKFYYLHGVPIDDPRFVTTPIEQIDAGRILEICNVDLRRELIRRKGLEQFLGQLFHRVIDKRGNYELLQIVLGETTREFGTYLKMLNPSIGVSFGRSAQRYTNRRCGTSLEKQWMVRRCRQNNMKQKIETKGQQGDVIMRRVGSDKPTGDDVEVLSKGRCILAQGEGHHIHVIDAPESEAELLRQGGRMLLWLSKPAQLHHVPTPASDDAPLALCGEHDVEEYPAGLWEIGGVREMDHFIQLERRVVINVAWVGNAVKRAAKPPVTRRILPHLHFTRQQTNSR